MGKLAASLSHEIRNPLSALKLNLNYLTMSKDQFDEDVNDSINSCLEAVERIQYLIENTLDFSRKPKRDIAYYSLNQIAEQAIHLIYSSAVQKYIVIESEFNKEIPLIRIDDNNLLQVLLNLLTNAVEASSKKGKIKVKTYPKNKYVILEVEDHGEGIREEDKKKIFGDFYTNKQQGTGLGLSVCKMLLDECGAELDFESILGKGSRFFVKFPAQLQEVK